MELLLLSALKWKMHLVTPLSFLDHIIRRLGLKNNLHWEFLGDYDTFYSQHNLSVEGYLQKSVRVGGINYLSSPEIGFLKAIGGMVNKARTKLVFVFLNPNDVEPTTSETYSEILKNLTAIKSFASSNVVPKNYIFPINNKTRYLDPATTLVTDAHKEGLEFAVDGFITDFPPTTSETIACFALNNVTKPVRGKPLTKGQVGFILAYQQAIDDGTDITDCSVHIIPAIQQYKGIFSFDLTWNEIQSLKPEMESPFATETDTSQRNPQAKNQGKFVTIDEFLELAKTKAVTGVQINIENAAYLASNKGLGIVDVVTKALSNATFDKQSTQLVLISSDDSSRMKDGFTVTFTNVLKEMHSADISVYVSVFKNEFISLAFDYFADPIIELATYIGGMGVDGIVIEFPATASKYLRNPCSDLNADLPYAILPIAPGDMLSIIPEPVQPPTSAPSPSLNIADIVDPPLPPVANGFTPDDTECDFGSSPNGAPPVLAPSSSEKTNVANIGVSIVAAILLCLLSM
ncbi:hypothetical protein Patl1_14750 [Pistacia atlantica]|uniref:Uncharacterized protein n=1 Tax=Pistacia atlantica TaxID=434234 RepID=A0ACC1ASS4_9ROSI|nr:hypothetical protein Patl1_14750 [Pistacia atlantica]